MSREQDIAAAWRRAAAARETKPLLCRHCGAVLSTPAERIRHIVEHIRRWA